jgi:hypothetical protein
MAHSVVELTVVLAILPSSGRRGGSCALPRAASRARLTKDRRPHNGGRGDVLSTWVPTVLEMTLQRRGWPHRAEVTGKMRPAVLL